MNLFRNRWVVGGLTLTAAALIVSNVIWPRAQGQRWRSAPPQIGTNAPLSPQRPQKSEAHLAAGPSLSQRSAVDWAATQASMAHGIPMPRRDPFRSGSDLERRATQSLVLKAIWRQTGGNLAVINDRLLAEGDPISELRVEKIESDRVWIVGPNGREALEFRPPEKKPSPPAVSDASPPTPGSGR